MTLAETQPVDPRSEILEKLRASGRLAHDYLFEHRHEDSTPDFHYEMIDLWHSSAPFVLTEAFRGAAKSTVAEESICTMAIGAAKRGFRNAIVIGASEERAIERLQAIKHEIETNERIHRVFGQLMGETWGAKKLVLSNGVCLQAKGRGQSMRGTKHLNERPDMVFLDDVEQDDEFIPTEENCKKVITWLFSVVIPAMHPRRRRLRVAGTPSSPFSLTMQLRKAQSWVCRKYPIVHVDPKTGDWVATWASRFPMDWVTAEKLRFAELHQELTWEQEMMLEPTDASQQLFTADMLKFDAALERSRTWQPVYAVYDPARTATARSGKTTALTGKAVFSWVGSRLLVWEIGAYAWKPDQIIQDCFDTDDKYSPVHIGIEEDGLHEFVAQPLRNAMVFRGHSLPIRPLTAPKGKIDFIKGLQPFAKAGEILFAQELPSHVKSQFLNFPVGVIDAPNALAYALKMRPGQPVYTAFGMQHIMPELEPMKRSPLFLCLNATKLGTTGALLQLDEGTLRVIADWVTDDTPGATLRHIIQSANIEAEGKVKIVAGPEHFKEIETIGLRAAATKIPVQLMQMGEPTRGREELRAMFGRQPGGRIPVQVSSNATWTLRAFSGGYARDYGKDGQLKADANDNHYRVLMEGIEAFLALANLTDQAGDSSINYAYAPDGRRFISSLPQNRRNPR